MLNNLKIIFKRNEKRIKKAQCIVYIQTINQRQNYHYIYYHI